MRSLNTVILVFFSGLTNGVALALFIHAYVKQSYGNNLLAPSVMIVSGFAIVIAALNYGRKSHTALTA